MTDLLTYLLIYITWVLCGEKPVLQPHQYGTRCQVSIYYFITDVTPVGNGW